MREVFVFALIIFSNLGLAQDGIFHQLYMEVDCAGIEIDGTTEGYHSFNSNFINLMSESTINDCSIPFMLNVKGYTRHLIIEGNHEEYARYFQAMVAHYNSLREREVAEGRICAEQAVEEGRSRDEEVVVCPSDLVLRLMLAANETWYQLFFSGEDQLSASGTAVAVVGASGGIWGAIAWAVPLLRSKTTKLLSAIRRYLMRPKTVNLGTRVGAAGTAASSRVEDQEELVSRSLADYPSPMTFFEGEQTYLQVVGNKLYGVTFWFRDRVANLGVSLAMLIPIVDTNLPYPQGGSFSARTYNPEDDIIDVIVGAGTVMGMVMFWEGVSRWIAFNATYNASWAAAARGLFGPGGGRRFLGGLAKGFGSFVGRYAMGFIGALTLATPILKYVASRRFNNRIEQFAAEKARLEGVIQSLDLRSEEALRATEAYVSLMKNYVLIYTGSRTLRLDQIEMDLSARLLCTPLAFTSSGHLPPDIIEEDMRGVLDQFVNRAEEVYANELMTEYFDIGIGLANEAMEFLETHATHPFYADSKADMYTTVSFLSKYQFRYSYMEMLARKVDVKTPEYLEQVEHLRVAREALESGRPMVPDGMSNEQWENYYAAREHFIVEKVSLELTGNPLRCEPEFYYKLFGLDYYRYHTPCDINRPEVDERYCLAN